MTYEPSKYQKVIFDWIENKKGNAIIQAVAGSGKTTTIVQATKIIPVNNESIFVAFNKSIADELKTKLPSSVQARTLHSLGLSLFYNNCQVRPQIKSDKTDDIVIKILEENNIPEEAWKKYLFPIKRLSSLCKNTLIDYKDLEQIMELVDKFNIEVEVNDILMSFLDKTMKESLKQDNVIDFDDMIWIPIIKNWEGKKFDFVFVDELQDLNQMQFELVKRVCNGNTRIIGVGDEKQSIYAFRGADTNSMQKFKKYFNAIELPLSICYRCPKKIIEEAQKFVPEIEAFEGNPEGVIDDIDIEEFLEVAKNEDLVLSRTNAPLVKTAFSLIRIGKKAVVRGRDIGKGLNKLINKYVVSDVNELHTKLYNFMRNEEKKLQMIEDGKYPKAKKSSIMNMLDSVETLFILMEGCDTIQEVKQKIKEIFSDKNEGIVCSSIHKAKGLEANNVYIINYENMPHPMAKSEEEIQQEYNIIYVALTRAKQELRFIKE